MTEPEEKTQTKQLNDVVDSLVDSAFRILEFRALLALGQHEEMPDNWVSFDHEQQDVIIDLVKPLLSSAQQTRKITAETSKDIIALIKKGKVSIAEGKELLVMTKMQLDVESAELQMDMKKKMMGMLGK